LTATGPCVSQLFCVVWKVCQLDWQIRYILQVTITKRLHLNRVLLLTFFSSLMKDHG